MGQEMTPELFNQLNATSPATLVDMYIKLRRKRNAAREIDKETNAKMDIIGSFIRQKMDALGQDGFKASGHVVFKSEMDTAKVNDSDLFFQFVKESLMFELLEARVSKEDRFSAQARARGCDKRAPALYD